MVGPDEFRWPATKTADDDDHRSQEVCSRTRARQNDKRSCGIAADASIVFLWLKNKNNKIYTIQIGRIHNSIIISTKRRRISV